MIVLICVGSSCSIKGSNEIAELYQKEIEKRGLMDDVTLAGSFCTGKCNRTGVSIQIDDKLYTGVSKESAMNFFEEHIARVLGKGRE